MPTFPFISSVYNGPVICPWSMDSCGPFLAAFSIPPSVTGAVVTQNLAYYAPFFVYNKPYVAAQMFVYNAATVAGNFDLGIYDSQGNRLVSSGSTLMAGASAIQFANITDTTLQPGGPYWMAFASNSATATFMVRTISFQAARGLFIRQQATAFALPDPATFAVPTISQIVEFGITNRTF